MASTEASAGSKSNAQTATCAASLVKQLAGNGPSTGSGPGGSDEFTVSVQDGTLEIRPAAASDPNSGLSYEGSWKLTDNSEGSGVNTATIKGQDALHALLVEVALAQRNGSAIINLDTVRLYDGQLDRLADCIKTSWWGNLTRQLDVTNTALTDIDKKVLTDDPRPRIYVPQDAPEQYDHYLKLADKYPDLRLDVQILPPPTQLTVEYIKTLDTKPGVLALATEPVTDADGNPDLRHLPFIVPGGRFNEMYGWDTFFASLGLLNDGLIDLAESILKNFCFCIQHYGKVFNANRTYYLGRSQPPFLTTLAIAIAAKVGLLTPRAREVIKLALEAALKEYYTVWMAKPRYDEETGLSRYSGEGLGFPPEVEPGHFDETIEEQAPKYNMSPAEFAEAYNTGKLQDPELDEYLRHDLAGRESGHDTTYRFIGHAADLATADLNSCLYKYETDIVFILDTYFDGSFDFPSEWQMEGMPDKEKSSTWRDRASKRQAAIDKYLWNEEEGMFFDYDTVKHEQTNYEAATTIWPLWAKAASPAQAARLVSHGLPRLEVHGGLVTSTERSRGEVSHHRPQRQWDYPHGWAPHQMLAWGGLLNYGYYADAERLMYRWVTMIVKTFTEWNGMVVEKYDVVSKEKNHVAEAEYGNQGSDFSSPVQTGFGWTNASLVCGAQLFRELRDIP